MKKQRGFAVVGFALLALLLTACPSAAPTGYDVLYRVTKADAAFVNRIEYRNASGETVERVSPKTPFVYEGNFDFGEAVRVGADAAGSASAPVTLELVVKRASDGSVVLQETRTCVSQFCTPNDFFIGETLSSSALRAANAAQGE